MPVIAAQAELLISADFRLGQNAPNRPEIAW